MCHASDTGPTPGILDPFDSAFPCKSVASPRRNAGDSVRTPRVDNAPRDRLLPAQLPILIGRPLPIRHRPVRSCSPPYPQSSMPSSQAACQPSRECLTAVPETYLEPPLHCADFLRVSCAEFHQELPRSQVELHIGSSCRSATPPSGRVERRPTSRSSPAATPRGETSVRRIRARA